MKGQINFYQLNMLQPESKLRYCEEFGECDMFTNKYNSCEQLYNDCVHQDIREYQTIIDRLRRGRNKNIK